LRTELKWMVVDGLARERVVAVALRLRRQRAHHLRVTAVATFTHIDVAPFQLKWFIGFDTRRRLDDRTLYGQRYDLDQAADADDGGDQHTEDTDLLFNEFGDMASAYD